MYIDPTGQFDRGLSVIPEPDTIQSAHKVERPRITAETAVSDHLQPFCLQSVYQIPYLGIFDSTQGQQADLFVSILLTGFSQCSGQKKSTGNVYFERRNYVFHTFYVFNIDCYYRASLLTHEEPRLISESGRSSDLASIPNAFPTTRVSGQRVSCRNVYNKASQQRDCPGVPPDSLLIRGARYRRRNQFGRKGNTFSFYGLKKC